MVGRGVAASGVRSVGCGAVAPRFSSLAHFPPPSGPPPLKRTWVAWRGGVPLPSALRGPVGAGRGVLPRGKYVRLHPGHGWGRGRRAGWRGDPRPAPRAVSAGWMLGVAGAPAPLGDKRRPPATTQPPPPAASLGCQACPGPVVQAGGHGAPSPFSDERCPPACTTGSVPALRPRSAPARLPRPHPRPGRLPWVPPLGLHVGFCGSRLLAAIPHTPPCPPPWQSQPGGWKKLARFSYLGLAR